jgi:maltose O-acetyltransferase
MKAAAVALCYYFYNAVITHVPVYSLRHMYLRGILRIGLGRGSSIHMGCFVTGRRIVVGERSVVNRECYLDGRVGLEIGNRVSVAPQSYLLSLTHDPQSPQFATVGAKTVVSDYVWVGVRAVVMPGVRLGKGCVVGAGAVVTQDVDEYCIVAGIPARKIGERTRDLDYNPAYRPYFNTDVWPR